MKTSNLPKVVRKKLAQGTKNGSHLRVVFLCSFEMLTNQVIKYFSSRPPALDLRRDVLLLCGSKVLTAL
ncbi:hypothetical protein [Chitinophaga sp. YIM B06452]|uniref:hypothetical protein n=1 Tax=Chitinophaga sp. YIM B06452 TaxID=3082158 RepID=UPI0031FEBE8E